jgi:hypothetical protein
VIAEAPITNVRVFRTLPIKDTFTFAKAMIKDAVVNVTENGVPVPMEFVDDSLGGYYRSVDTTFRAKHNAIYELQVIARGKTLTATAQTRGAFDWVKPPVDTLNYPGRANETRIYDSLNISWQGQAGTERYSNRRLRDPEDEFDDGTLIANERTRFGFTIVSNTPVVWFAFKWFGRHRLHIYTGDEAFQEWHALVGFGRRSNYDYRLGNVVGGLGVWAGASQITSDIFLKKDQP